MNNYKSFVPTLMMSLFIIGCGSDDSTQDQTQDQAALDAFSRVDGKNKNLFTSKDRKNKYKASLASTEKAQANLQTNATFNSYGSSKKTSQKKNIPTPSDTENKAKKKYNYNSSSRVSAKTYSAYSTN